MCQKSLAEFAAAAANKVKTRFLPGRVPGRKHFSGCKCGICPPTGDKLCAQQTAKTCRKAPKGFFDNLKNPSTNGGGIFLCIHGVFQKVQQQSPGIVHGFVANVHQCVFVPEGSQIGREILIPEP